MRFIIIFLFVAPCLLAQYLAYKKFSGLFGDPGTKAAALERNIPQLMQRFAGLAVARNIMVRAGVTLHGYCRAQSNPIAVTAYGVALNFVSPNLNIWKSCPIKLEEIQPIQTAGGHATDRQYLLKCSHTF